MELGLGPDAPLLVKYTLEKSAGELQFYLAPIIDDKGLGRSSGPSVVEGPPCPSSEQALAATTTLPLSTTSGEPQPGPPHLPLKVPPSKLCPEAQEFCPGTVSHPGDGRDFVADLLEALGASRSSQASASAFAREQAALDALAVAAPSDSD